jgi:hypothetical protein
MTDVPMKRPNGHNRQHWLSREELDGRTRASKMFCHVENSVIEDLGGEDNISAVQRHLVSAFAGMAVCLEDLNVRVMLGEPIDLNAFATCASTLIRTANKLGVRRVPKDVTPSLADILSEASVANNGPD